MMIGNEFVVGACIYLFTVGSLATIFTKTALVKTSIKKDAHSNEREKRIWREGSITGPAFASDDGDHACHPT
jgi:hypothetical protein